MRETELQHKESDTLPRSGEIYKALVAYSQDAILGVNRKGIIVFWNSGAERIFGYSAEEIVGQPITNLVSEKRRQGQTSVLRALLGGSSGETRTLAGEALRKDGSTFPIELSFSNEQQSGKSVALAIVKNVTRRKQMQKALKESAERYCNLFSACLETVFSAPMRDNTETTNEALEKLCSYCLQELARMTTEVALPEEAREYLSEQVDTILSIDEGASNIVHKVLSKNGRRILTERYLNSLEIRDKPSGFQVLNSEVAERDTSEGQLKSSFINLAKVVSHVIQFCDPYTANHQERVAELACLVARNMGLADDVVERLYFNGLLHDIGKISIPRSILTKPGELADEEWALIRAHTKQGYHILKDANLPWPVADVALQHHERLDGSGYPNGIAGDELNLEVGILAVCDVVEAMSSHRPYRPARTTGDILKELTDGRGTRYDASVVDVVLPKVENGEFRSMWTCGN
jgi:PAS domain S-box-containing protein/putative nucleotidyltransferase with HDIG domain